MLGTHEGEPSAIAIVQIVLVAIKTTLIYSPSLTQRFNCVCRAICPLCLSFGLMTYLPLVVSADELVERREEFEARKKALRERSTQKTNAPKQLSSSGKVRDHQERVALTA